MSLLQLQGFVCFQGSGYTILLLSAYYRTHMGQMRRSALQQRARAVRTNDPPTRVLMQAQGRAGERLQHRAGAELRLAVDALQHHHLVIHLEAHCLAACHDNQVATCMPYTLLCPERQVHIACLPIISAC